MKKSTLVTCGSILFSSLLALSVDVFVTTPGTRNSMIVLLASFILSLLFAQLLPRLNASVREYGKIVILILAAMLTQLLVFSFGGVKSPFFIFFHLFFIGISFIFGYKVSLTFFASSLIALVLQMYLSPGQAQLLREDPITTLFLLFTYPAIIPLVTLLTNMYYGKDTLSQALTKQVTLDETLLHDVDEMLIVTDTSLRIVSVNAMVEDILNKPSMELVDRSVFSVVFLKNTKGEVLSEESINHKDILEQKKISHFNDLLFLPLNGQMTRKVDMKVSPVVNLEGKAEQLCFFISDKAKKVSSSEEEHPSLGQAQLMYNARVEDLKKRLSQDHLTDLHTRFVLLTHAQDDIILARQLEDHGISVLQTRFDLANASKEVITREASFTNIFQTQVQFSFTNFGKEDILPLLPKDGKTDMDPEHFTGPFFTIRGDGRKITTIIQKLLNISIILAYSSRNKKIKMILERGNREQVYLHVHAPCIGLSSIELQHLFEPYYPDIAAKTGLFLGSGLEGYIAKTLTDHVDIPLKCLYQESSGELIFTLRFTRDVHTLS